MPDWLFEGLWEVYISLGLAAFVLLIIWWRHRKRYWLYGVAAFVALILLYMLLDFAVETDREQIGVRLQRMSQAVHNHNLNEAFQMVADDGVFDEMNKTALRSLAAANVNNVSDVVFKEYHFLGKTSDSPPVANVEFNVKVLGNINTLPMFCRAQFRKDPAKGWQIRRVELFDAFHNDEPIHIRSP